MRRSCARSRREYVAHDRPAPRSCSGRQVAAGDRDLRRREKPSWRWARDVRRAEALELASRRRWARRSVGGHARARRPPRRRRRRRPSTSKSRSATQSPWQLLVDLSLRSSSMPNLSTKTLMRARARLTRSQSWRSKMRKTASATFEVLAVVGPDEVVERRGDARHDRRAAADADLEAALTPSRSRGDEGDVVDAGERAVLVGEPSKAVLTLRGMSCVVGWRTK